MVQAARNLRQHPKPTKLTRARVDEIMSEVQSLYAEAEDALNRKRDTLLENMAMYRGMQYLVRSAEYVTEGEEATGEARETQNMVRQIVKAAVAARLRSMPNPEMPASTSDHFAYARAKATERFAQSMLHNGTFTPGELDWVVLFAVIMGGGWLKIYWDPRSGRVRELDESNLELVDDDWEDRLEDSGDDESDTMLTQDGPEGWVGSTYEGDVAVEAISRFDGLHDPSARRPSEMQYFVHRKLRTVRELEMRFPVDVFGKRASFMTDGRSYIQAAMRSVLDEDEGEVGGNIEGRNDGKMSLAELAEFWEVPTERYPRGRLVIFSGPTCLYLGDNPYRPATIPFEPFFGDNVVPGTFFPDGIVEDIKCQQRSLNRTASKMREWVDRVSHAWLLLSKGSGIDPNTFEDISGAVIPYNPGHKPEYSRPPDIPISMFQYEQDQKQAMKDVSGYSDIALGGVPKNVASGRHQAFAKENESALREPDMMLFRWSVLRSLRQAVLRARQYYPDGRMLTILGEDGWVRESFRADDYEWGVDFVPEAYSGAPTSHAQRVSETLEMHSAGLFEDTPAAKAARALLSRDYASMMTWTPNEPWIKKARRQIQILIDNPTAPIRVQSWDRHDAMLEVFNGFRASIRYEELHPYAQQALDQVCEEHEYWHAQQEEAFAASQQMLDPGRGPPPPGQPQAPSPATGGASPLPPMMGQAPTQQELVTEGEPFVASIEQQQ